MKFRSASLRRIAVVPFACTAILGVLTACDNILDTTQDLAENAQILIDGDSPVLLTLVLSNVYTGTTNPSTGYVSTTLLSADTLTVDVPVDQIYPLGGQARLFVRLINPDSNATANVRLRVLLDGTEEVYNVQALLKASFLEFRYAYF
jgi:hypothetical protein